MSKVNIANYVIYDLANRFNCVEHCGIDNEIIDMVAEHWHKRHSVQLNKDIKHHHEQITRLV